MLSIQVLKPRQSWSPRPCVRYQNGNSQALEHIYIKFISKLVEALCTYVSRFLDANQPREQAGFRSKYSTTDHIHAINQLKEKCREYNIPLCVAFVDCEKAFDSVQTQAILTSLQEQGIEDVYI